jgi:hypothetical protein
MVSTKNDNYAISSIDDLHEYLYYAMSVEHSTIPPYIMALYSIKPGTNLQAFQILRSVAVEEMLHLTLVANVFNAVGGKIENTLTRDDFIPTYPGHIATGETDFEVSLGKFSRETVETFLNIERAKHVHEDKPLVGRRDPKKRWLTRVPKTQKHEGFSFYSIGLFYAEIIRGLNALYQKHGDDLFCGNPQRQISPDYYYDGGGEIIPVKDLRSAIRALKVIQDQGEGSRQGTIYDAERELSHYCRFEQLVILDTKYRSDLKKNLQDELGDGWKDVLGEDWKEDVGGDGYGQYYRIDKNNPENSDKPFKPTGEKFEVDWDAVYPAKTNAKLSDYPQGSELYTAAKQFQSDYKDFLGKIEYSFDGHPESLMPAIGGMFKLKYQAEQIIKNPIPGEEGVNGAPIFRLD